MRESQRMECYAQRAINQRRAAHQVEVTSKMLKYLNQGKLINKVLCSIEPLERQDYILKHQELIISSDGAEGVNVVWGPNAQVCTHRLLSAEMRKEFNGEHYLGSWVRQVAPHQRSLLKDELVSRLEARVAQRKAEANQLVIELESIPADEPVPDFIRFAPDEEMPEFLR